MCWQLEVLFYLCTFDKMASNQQGLFVTDVALFDKSQFEIDTESGDCIAPIFDIQNGQYWYNIRIPKSMYESKLLNMPMKPHHVRFASHLQDVPLMTDYAGLVNEARQRIDIVNMEWLRSDVHVSKGFATGLIGFTVPYVFQKGVGGTIW